MFYTGVDAAPVSTKGTAFVGVFRGQLFAITARHVTGDMVPQNVLIFPSAGNQPFRLTGSYGMPSTMQGTEIADIQIFTAEVPPMTRSDREESPLLNFDGLRRPWHEARFSSMFFLCGWPSSRAHVSFARRTVKNQQILFGARYTGRLDDDVHTLAVLRNDLQVGSFDGLSGSPVFACENRLCAGSTVGLAGFAIRGSAQSERIHFLDAMYLYESLEAIVEGRLVITEARGARPWQRIRQRGAMQLLIAERQQPQNRLSGVRFGLP